MLSTEVGEHDASPRLTRRLAVTVGERRYPFNPANSTLQLE
ncbi:hypothetical protein [Microcella sp.]